MISYDFRRFPPVGYCRILLSESDGIRLSENVGSDNIRRCRCRSIRSYQYSKYALVIVWKTVKLFFILELKIDVIPEKKYSILYSNEFVTLARHLSSSFSVGKVNVNAYNTKTWFASFHFTLECFRNFEKWLLFFIIKLQLFYCFVRSLCIVSFLLSKTWIFLIDKS